MSTPLERTLTTLSVLGDESRLRLCLLLAERELNVGDLVRVTGIAQSRVSSHLARLRDAGLVRDRREGAQAFYALRTGSVSSTVSHVLAEARASSDPTLIGDRERLEALDVEKRAGRDAHTPGRTWQSLAAGIAGLLDLGDVLDVGCGDASAASKIVPYCRSLTCIDTSEKEVEAARARLGGSTHVRTLVADAEAMPFEGASFDAALVFHTLTHTKHPARLLAECARVLRPGGRVVVLCLDAHRQLELTARYGERHPGLSPRRVHALLTKARFQVRTCEVASHQAKKPHLDVVLAIGDKPSTAEARSTRT